MSFPSRLFQFFPTPPHPKINVASGAFGFLFFFFFFFFLLPQTPWAATGQISANTSALVAKFIEADVLAPSGLLFGLFIGIMLTASLYLFFIWIVIRDRSQLLLMILLVCLGVNMVSTNEQIMELLGQHNPVTRSLLQNNSMLLSYLASIFFTYYFLEVDLHAPGLHIPLFFLAVFLFMLFVYNAFDQQPVIFILPSLGTIAIIAVLTTGLVTLQNDVSGSLSHIIAFIFFLLGGIAEPLHELGFIEDGDISKNMAYLFFSVAALLFAIVIAGQFATRQEEKERALALSNERFALAAKGSNEGLFDWNRATGEIFFSDRFKKILGVSLESNPKGLKTWTRMIMMADRIVIFSALRRFRHNFNASVINFEYRIEGSGSDWRWLHTKAVATRDPATHKIVRFVGSIGDITSRKRSESDLKASEIRFRSITEAHPVPVLIVQTEDNRLLYASPSAEALLGLPHNMLLSYRLNRFVSRAKERNEIIEAMNAGQEVNLKEVTITRGDGQSLPAALSARRINYQNEPAMVIGLYDLTETKRAEAQIAKQQEALQQSEKMAALGGLLAGVAHELNNPLSVVVGQATLLSEGTSEQRVKTRAEKIFKAADRCSRIVKSFLAIARRKPPERKPQNINSIINASLELLGYQFRNENVAITIKLDPQLPAVMGDGDQLTQVFTNLALNSAQAMQGWAGSRQLTIKTETFDDQSILISFIDTGPGIPPEIRTRIFEPFFTTKGSEGGTGVGLSLCLNIIESHDGRLQLEETPGGGATFSITLPIAVAKGCVSESSDAAKNCDTPQKLKILIVDDEVELAQTLADLFEPEGYEIEIAANGALALQKIEKASFDVIISDLRMPVLDGPGLYAELSKIEPKYINRIIYVTGDTLSPHVQSFLAKTPVPVIEKPYRLADVRQALAELLKDDKGECSMSPSESAPPPPDR